MSYLNCMCYNNTQVKEAAFDNTTKDATASAPGVLKITVNATR